MTKKIIDYNLKLVQIVATIVDELLTLWVVLLITKLGGYRPCELHYLILSIANSGRIDLICKFFKLNLNKKRHHLR